MLYVENMERFDKFLSLKSICDRVLSKGDIGIPFISHKWPEFCLKKIVREDEMLIL